VSNYLYLSIALLTNKKKQEILLHAFPISLNLCMIRLKGLHGLLIKLDNFLISFLILNVWVTFFLTKLS